MYQQEVLCGFLTVEEHLLFHAVARMSDRHPQKAIIARIDEVCTYIRRKRNLPFIPHLR